MDHPECARLLAVGFALYGVKPSKADCCIDALYLAHLDFLVLRQIQPVSLSSVSVSFGYVDVVGVEFVFDVNLRFC